MNSPAQQHALRHSARLPGHCRPVSCASAGVCRANGNLLAIGSITYGTTTRTNNAGPHAVAAAQSRNYFYDLNGNLEQIRNGDNSVARSISYTPFNLPASIILEWVSSALDLDRLKTLLHTLRPDV